MANKSDIRVVYRDPAELIPYARNARTHSPEQIAKLAASIKEFGFTTPVELDGENGILSGHGRVLAAQKLGLKRIPTIDLSGLTEAQRRAYILAANRLALDAGWDEELLAIELSDLSGLDVDLSVTGFTDEEIEQALQSDGLTADDEDAADEIPEADPAETAKTKRGDVWICGGHRVMCGDSTSAADVEILTKGEKADLFFTDPPYGMGKESQGVENDNQNAEELERFNAQWVPLSLNALKDSASWYCWGTDRGLLDLYASILKPQVDAKDLVLKNFIQWEKPNPAGLNSGDRMFHPSGEKCLFLMKGRENYATFQINTADFSPKMQPVLDWQVAFAKKLGLTPAKVREITGSQMWGHWFTRSQFAFMTRENFLKLLDYGIKCGTITQRESEALKGEYEALKGEYEALKGEYEEKKREFYGLRAYFDNGAEDAMTDCWHFPVTAGKEREQAEGHATPKPVALCERAVKTSCPMGGVVIDLFGGSGSTLIAAENTGRRCYAMEIQERFADVIVLRWQNLTGKQAVRESDGRLFDEI